MVDLSARIAPADSNHTISVSFLFFIFLPFVRIRETGRDARKLPPLSGPQRHPQLVLEEVLAGGVKGSK